MSPWDPKRSGFWFYGRLAPHADALFDVDEVEVGEATFLSVAWDGIAVYSRPDAEGLEGWRGAVRSPEEAARLFRLVAGAYTLLTERAYDATLEGWIEATDASFDLTIFGFRVHRFGLDRLPAADRENLAMTTAAEIAGAVRERPGFRQALLDLLAAYRDRGDDAFLFAYRAIEDVAREVTGAVDLRASDWSDFHERLGRDPRDGKTVIEPLTVARRAAAHGDDTDAALIAARDERDARLRIGRSFVAEALTLNPDVPMSMDDLWS